MSPRGGDMPAAGSSRSRPASFNPRPREEATAAGKGALTTTGFQPTPPRGGDNVGILVPARNARFQPTPPRGGDPSSPASRPGIRRFNPRPREEATRQPAQSVAHRNVSTHAPARRRPTIVMAAPCPACFNPRPREEATKTEVLDARSLSFQPTPPRGGDGDVDDLFLDEGSRFNPRPREEATPLC